MRLGIDLDGVVADFLSGWMGRYNDDFAADLKPEMVTGWNAFVPLTHFDTSAEFWTWAEGGDGPGIFRHLPTYPGAVEALQRLGRNHEIVIITTKPVWANAETYAWISESAIPTNEVHITGRKWQVDCDIYLDDGPHNLEALTVERPDRTICRFVRPWNSPIHGTVDIDSWDTFEALVDQQYC